MPKRRTAIRGRKTPPDQSTLRRVGGGSGGVAHFVTRTIGTALAGVRDVGTEVGRLAVDVADEAIQVADRLAAAAGRAAKSLMDATVAGVAGFGGPPRSQVATDSTPQRSKAKPPSKARPGAMAGAEAPAMRKPLARSPQRSARPRKVRRRGGSRAG